MKTLLPWAAIAAALIFRASSAAAEHPASCTLAGDRGIESRSVPVPGQKIESGRATTVVDAPLETVVSVIEDYARYREFLPNFRQSRVLSRRGQNAMVYLEASILHGSATLWAQMHMSSERLANATEVVHARLVQGNVRDLSARWELAPVDGGRRTQVALEFRVAPGLPLPASLFTKENVSAARRTIEALRDRVRETRLTARR